MASPTGAMTRRTSTTLAPPNPDQDLIVSIAKIIEEKLKTRMQRTEQKMDRFFQEITDLNQLEQAVTCNDERIDNIVREKIPKTAVHVNSIAAAR